MKLIYPDKFIIPKGLILDSSLIRPKGIGILRFLRYLKFSGTVTIKGHKYNQKYTIRKGELILTKPIKKAKKFG